MGFRAMGFSWAIGNSMGPYDCHAISMGFLKVYGGPMGPWDSQKPMAIPWALGFSWTQWGLPTGWCTLPSGESPLGSVHSPVGIPPLGECTLSNGESPLGSVSTPLYINVCTPALLSHLSPCPWGVLPMELGTPRV